MNTDALRDAVEKAIDQYEDCPDLQKGAAYLDGGAQMLFPRLRRAAMNQCTAGDATFSRYAIWANTVRDHIDEAIRALETGDSEEATRLLKEAHNSLSAFSEIQRLFDPFERQNIRQR